MQLDIIYTRTEQGQKLSQAAGASMARARRLLSMIDGRQTVVDLLPAMKLLGLRIDEVHALATEGLIQPIDRPPRIQ